MTITVPVSKDDEQQPVATAWRSTLKGIADALASRDFALQGGLPDVLAVSSETARQIASYVSEYGETLVELPSETWASSVSQWMLDYWDVLVDLWTEESTRSDLVLFVRVFEGEGSFRYEVQGVWVP